MINSYRPDVLLFQTARFFHQGVDDLANSNYFLSQEVVSRVVALSLPVIHGIFSLSYLSLGLVAKVVMLESFSEIEHSLGGYFWKLSSFHLDQLAQSIFQIVSPGGSTTILPRCLSDDTPKKGVFFRSGFKTRIGSNLKTYIQARWIAYKLQEKIPEVRFIHREFNFADQFRLSEMSEYSLPTPYSIPGFISPHDFKTLSRKDLADFHTIDEVSEFFEENDGIVEILPFSDIDHIKPDWDNVDFTSAIREELQLIESSSVELSRPPEENVFSIALHVRTGGNFDSERTRQSLPRKFPPNSYYEFSIDKAIEQKAGRRVYIRIFTDSLNPVAIKQHFSGYITNRYPNLEFEIDVSEEENSQKSPLGDMFSFPLYDALIRPDSGLSSFAGKLTDFELEVFPSQSRTEDQSAVTEVKLIRVNDEAKEERRIVREFALDQTRFIFLQ